MYILRKINTFIFLVVSLYAESQNPLVVGSYVGDGAASKSITGIGFQPDVLIVKATAQYAYIKTADMGGDSSKNMVTATDLEVNNIKTLDADGFTVGNSAAVNSSGVTYYYQAFDASANLKIGTYTGGSTMKSISGLGWRADFAIIMPGTTSSGKGACSEYFMTSSTTSINRRFTSSTNRTAMSLSPSNADGFEVASTVTATKVGAGSVGSTSSSPPGASSTNTNSKKYYYAAWNAGTDMEIGTYLGNNTDNTDISVTSIDPIVFLIIKGDPTGTGSTQESIMKSAAMSGESTCYFTNSADIAGDAIQSMSASANTFQIGADATANANATSTTYYFAAFGGTSVTLPIQLLSFHAELNSPGVDLSWITVSENNNDYFTIERSADGLHFEPVARVKGAGNSSESIYYFATDKQALKGISYYRLKQTDFDGKFTYSKVSIIDNSFDTKELVIFPNPMENSSNIFFLKGSEDYSRVSIKIINTLGENVFETENKNISESSLVPVSLRHKLVPGIYLVIIEYSKKKSILKLLVR